LLTGERSGFQDSSEHALVKNGLNEFGVGRLGSLGGDFECLVVGNIAQTAAPLI
jgi:hypothetical protein